MSRVFNVTAVAVASVLSLSICTQAKAQEKKYFACVATVYGFEPQRMNSGNKPIAYFYTNMFEGRMDGSMGWWKYQDAFESSLYAKELKGRSDVQSVVSDCTSEKVRSDSFNSSWSAAMSAAKSGAKGWETTAALSEWLPDDKVHKAVVAYEAERAKYTDSAGRNPQFVYCYSRDMKQVSKLMVAGGLEQDAFAAKTGISRSDSLCAGSGTPEGAKYNLRRIVGLEANYVRVNWPVTEAEMASVMLPTRAAQGGVSKQLAGIVVSFDEKPTKADAGKPAPRPTQQATNASSTPSPSSAPLGKQDCHAMMARGEKCAAAQ